MYYILVEIKLYLLFNYIKFLYTTLFSLIVIILYIVVKKIIKI